MTRFDELNEARRAAFDGLRYARKREDKDAIEFFDSKCSALNAAILRHTFGAYDSHGRRTKERPAVAKPDRLHSSP